MSPINSSCQHTSKTSATAIASPAFLSLLPRSLSSLSLGTKKKIEKDHLANTITTSEMNSIHLSQSIHNQRSSSHQHHINLCISPPSTNNTPVKKKFSGSRKNLKEEIPPPLPQRNIPRAITCEPLTNEWRRSTIISDLDHSIGSPVTLSLKDLESPNRNNNISSNQKRQQRTKSKTKALSDPKMSTQLFLLMEKSDGEFLTPPPLPPRQPGMAEEVHFNNDKRSNIRPSPNSIEAQWNYPLVTTCQSVKDNGASAFPLSQRPNIVQQLKNQQNLKAIVSTEWN